MDVTLKPFVKEGAVAARRTGESLFCAPVFSDRAGIENLISGYQDDITMYTVALQSSKSEKMQQYYTAMISKTQSKISNLERELERG